MRDLYLEALKTCFNNALLSCECRKHSTHAQMASLLAMDVRSYADLDHGRSCCSSLTLARYLIYCSDDPLEFLNELRGAFEEIEAERSKP